MEVIRFNNVSKIIRDNVILRNINVFLYNNRIIGLLGPSGSGKTEMISLIMGLSSPTIGSITVNEETPSVWCHQFVSYLPQKVKLNLNIDLNELIDIHAEKHNDFDKKIALHLSNILKLQLDKNILKMTKLEKQIAQFMLVMSRSCLIYILDEPLSSADVDTRNTILKLVLDNYKSNCTIIISTSRIDGIKEIIDDAIVLKQGKIIIKGSVNNLEKRTKKDFVEIYKSRL